MALQPELVVLYADGECSPEEAGRVQAGLRESAEARELYALLVRQRLMLAEVCARAAAPVVIVTPVLPAAPVRSRRAYWVAAAAAAALLVLGTGLGWLLRGRPPAGYVLGGPAGSGSVERLAYGSLLEPPAAQTVEAVLADNSVVSVAPESRVRVAARRRLELESGRVGLVCAHDRNQRFVVTAGDATVTALGTEFVVAYDEATDSVEEGVQMNRVVRVAVISGAVLLANGLGQLQLSAGEEGQGRRGRAPEKVKKSKAAEEGQVLHPEVFALQDLGDEDLLKLGKCVQELLADGLRGEELAAAIHARIEVLKAARRARKQERKRDHKHEGEGQGHGHGHGPHEGEGQGHGHGQGPHEGEGQGHGHGHGKGPRDGEGKGHGKGPRDGEGQGHGKGPRDGEGKGHGKGPREGEGQGHGKGPRDGEGKGHGKGPRDGEGQGHGKGPREGEGQGHGRGPREGEGKGRGRGKDTGGKKERERDRERDHGGDEAGEEELDVVADGEGIDIF
jgi:ferric-dicitrate binding protein FerR (iron transport regulator)